MEYTWCLRVYSKPAPLLIWESISKTTRNIQELELAVYFRKGEPSKMSNESDSGHPNFSKMEGKAYSLALTVTVRKLQVI